MDEIGAEQTKEEELAKALKASMDTTLEEQAAPEAGYLFGDFPGNFPITHILLYIMFCPNT